MSDAPSLVLAAHGWPTDSPAHRSLEYLVQETRQRGVFGQVRLAYLRGEPALESVLDEAPAGNVVVVPIMTSEGYYADQLRQRILESSPVARREQQVELRPVVGADPAWPRLFAERARQHQRVWQLDPTESTILLVGHGTRRHPNSGEATEAIACQMRDAGLESKVEVAFLDQAPELAQAGKAETAEHLIVIPFLVASGPHLVEDIPAALGWSPTPGGTFPQAGWARARGRRWLRLCEGPLLSHGRLPEIITASATCSGGVR